ncbi:MAG TPA: hypothetical protein VD706_02445, partial [Candidatus Saccharimonadales bacterium]|nr:hypothetical protein [Candidatus Saccharimonadales bacterium]
MTYAATGPFRVFLMILFSLVEWPGLLNPRDDRIFETRLRIILDFFSGGKLFIIEAKDSRTVTVADIGTLAVELGGIMHPEKLPAERPVAHLLRIEVQQYGFGVTGRMG